MNNGKLKIEKTKEGMNCHIDGPTEKAAIVRDAIIYAMTEMKVNGDEVLPVLGEAVIEFLIVIAKACDEDELELIKDFGEGIVTAQVELKK
jgi:hypothetical protein